jgi:hypothetical protein
MFNPYCISRGALSTIPEILKFSWARFPDLPKKLPAITGWKIQRHFNHVHQLVLSGDPRIGNS